MVQNEVIPFSSLPAIREHLKNKHIAAGWTNLVIIFSPDNRYFYAVDFEGYILRNGQKVIFSGEPLRFLFYYAKLYRLYGALSFFSEN